MMKILIFALLVSGCAIGSEADLIQENVVDTIPKPPLPRSEPGDIQLPNISVKIRVDSNIPECKPETFMADAIPHGFQLDPNCPPNIIWPPAFIWPNDPSPIINPPVL
jgi:hypothetical protein